MPQKKKGYIWQVGSAPPPIEAHSIQKHKVLAAYLRSYVRILGSVPQSSSLTLTVIDGFAGGGIYLDKVTGNEHLGSPFLIPEAIRNGESEINLQRLQQGVRTPFQVNAEYHYIEKRRCNFGFLTAALQNRGYKDALGEKLFLHQGTFENLQPKMVERVANRSRRGRCIFLLDQYGYSDVPLPTIKDIFGRLPFAEVILTFATDALISYLSRANLAKYQRTFEEKLQVSIDLERLLNEGDNSPSFRRFVQSELITHLHNASGARFFTPFFITSRKSSRAYWLIHFSMHPRARDAMLTEHWKHDNSFAHYGRPGLDMLGYSPKDDLDAGIQRALEFEFDSVAKDMSHASLLNEIPSRLCKGEPVQVEEFLTALANETPVTRAQMLEAIRQLSASKSILVLNADGRLRSPGAQVHTGDGIEINNQRCFALPIRNT